MKSEKPKKPFYKRNWFIITLALFVFFTIVGKLVEKPVTKVAVAENDNTSEKVTPPDDQLSALKKSLSYFTSEMNMIFDSVGHDNIEGLTARLILIKGWSELYIDNSAHSDDSVRVLADGLKSKLSSLQSSEFPKMRTAFNNIIASDLWVEDIYAEVSGTRSTVLNFTGALFATNKNIKEFHDLMYDMSSKLRFKEVRYRWYKGASEYTRFNTSEVGDDEVVRI